MIELSTYSRGRLALPLKLVKNLNISEGDAFIIETKDEKIIYTKIKKEDLKKLTK